MKIYIIILLFIPLITFAQNIWINEFHYENSGEDTSEFIEIVLQNAGSYSLKNFHINLYSNGNTYGNPLTLEDFTLHESDLIDNSFSYFYYLFEEEGLQDGPKDGICLDYDGKVIQFISYDGTFEAKGGPANGLKSADIGVTQSGSTPPGSSVGLEGGGKKYNDFSWEKFDGKATMGSPNINQVLPVELMSFTASVSKNQILLKWETKTEVNNYGFEIERAVNSGETGSHLFSKVGFVQGSGNSNSDKQYNFTDNINVPGRYLYRLKQIDSDGTYSYSHVIGIDAGQVKGFVLGQNYPNPFNPVTTIQFVFEENAAAELIVFNTLGNEVACIFKGNAEAGRVYEVIFDASELSTGVYFYRLSGNNMIQIKKMLMLK